MMVHRHSGDRPLRDFGRGWADGRKDGGFFVRARATIEKFARVDWGGGPA